MWLKKGLQWKKVFNPSIYSVKTGTKEVIIVSKTMISVLKSLGFGTMELLIWYLFSIISICIEATSKVYVLFIRFASMPADNSTQNDVKWNCCRILYMVSWIPESMSLGTFDLFLCFGEIVRWHIHLLSMGTSIPENSSWYNEYLIFRTFITTSSECNGHTTLKERVCGHLRSHMHCLKFRWIGSRTQVI